MVVSAVSMGLAVVLPAEIQNQKVALNAVA